MQRVAKQFLVLLSFCACPLGAGEPPVKAASLEQHLGAQVPLHAQFQDSRGQIRPLGDLLGERPTILAMGYYECPNLCSLVLNAISDSLVALPMEAGVDYNLIFVSVDPAETAQLAASKKRSYVRYHGKPGTEEGWHFLRGEAEAVAELATRVGFGYQFQEETGQWAHPAGILVLTPSGKVSRYLYGIEYPPRDLRLALVEASGGAIGTAVDQIMLLCYRYDATTGRYGLLINRVIQAAGGLTVLILGSCVGFLLYRERKEVSAKQ